MTEPVDEVDPAAVARVVDFETTGLPEEEGSAICEVGFVDVFIDRPLEPVVSALGYETLVNPGVKMRPELCAIHHLTDADLADAAALEVAAHALLDGMSEHDIFVAHNAKMEHHFFPVQTPHRWIDTYRVALRAWPDAPGHSNQVLRYWLEQQGRIAPDRWRTMPPHRALPDAYVTALILTAILQMGRPISRLVQISSEPGFLPVVRFGKHYGTRFEDLPIDYLEWMVEAGFEEDEDFTARYWLRKKQQHPQVSNGPREEPAQTQLAV